MQLLPSNSSLREQKFASFLDEMAKEDYDVLSICPLECKAFLLPHLALWLRVDIDGLEESEAREYLKSALTNRTKKGTVGVVEDSIKPFFRKSVLIEWFNDNELKRGEFKINVSSLKNMTYDKEQNILIRKVIESAKNVRSHLKSINFNIDYENKAYVSSALNMQVELTNEWKLSWNNKNINYTGGVAWQI